jgi:CBS domain-containing membrane protein
MREQHYWINQVFKRHPLHFIMQSVLVVLYMLGVMLVLTYSHVAAMNVLTAVGATSLASSAFLVFTMPKSPSAKAYRVIGSYLCAMIAGIIGHYLAVLFAMSFSLGLTMSQCFGAALAAGVVMVMMSMLDFAHPPAMGIAIGVVLDYWDDRTLIILLLAVLVLTVIKRVFHRWFINLV